MQHTTVTVGRVTYFLDVARTRESVEAATLAALARGGDYVTLDLAGGSTLEVLVSRGMTFVVGTGIISDEAA